MHPADLLHQSTKTRQLNELQLSTDCRLNSMTARPAYARHWIMFRYLPYADTKSSIWLISRCMPYQPRIYKEWLQWGRCNFCAARRVIASSTQTRAFSCSQPSYNPIVRELRHFTSRIMSPRCSPRVGLPPEYKPLSQERICQSIDACISLENNV